MAETVVTCNDAVAAEEGFVPEFVVAVATGVATVFTFAPTVALVLVGVLACVIVGVLAFAAAVAAAKMARFAAWMLL
jgi:hypothetical protein